MEKLYKLIMAGQLDFDPDIWARISPLGVSSPHVCNA